ncbi:cytochrome b5 [Aplysia californica]|uniref:Cytochrome b5 n=1 Tax=Aplysia californica TaxID=6500 RepID=A0ABM0JK24_APLCA|nr:cytochrome b5 [Aplysia californica]
MSSYVKSGLCLALAALQISPDNSRHDVLVEAKVSQKVVQPLSPSNDNNNNKPSHDDENAAPRYSRTEVAEHCHYDSCWIVVNNKVYDVTRFLRQHPGGDDIILEYAGFDATSVFIDKGHSRDAYEMLAEYFIGEVTEKDWLPEMNCT